VQLDYVAKRCGVFLLIVWLAATLNFFLPRLSGQDPVRADRIFTRDCSAPLPVAARRLEQSERQHARLGAALRGVA
jgi:hypothetical protein